MITISQCTKSLNSKASWQKEKILQILEILVCFYFQKPITFSLLEVCFYLLQRRTFQTFRVITKNYAPFWQRKTYCKLVLKLFHLAKWTVVSHLSWTSKLPWISSHSLFSDFTCWFSVFNCCNLKSRFWEFFEEFISVPKLRWPFWTNEIDCT